MVYQNIKELITHGQLVFNLAIMKVAKMACGIKAKLVRYSLTDNRLTNSLPSFKWTISSSSCCFSSFCTPLYAIIPDTVRHFHVQRVSANPAPTSPPASYPCLLCSLLCLPRWQLQLKFTTFTSNSSGYAWILASHTFGANQHCCERRNNPMSLILLSQSLCPAPTIACPFCWLKICVWHDDLGRGNPSGLPIYFFFKWPG